jgi:hypothetical protein
MDSRKILIVSRSFYPMNSPRSFRTTELAKEFKRQGHEVIVLTHKNGIAHTSFENDFNIVIKDLGKPKWRGITTKGGYLKNLFLRSLNFFLNKFFEYPNIELMGMVKKALKNEKGYNLLISIATPHPIHWGVASVRGNKRKIADTWIADCGDPYMGRESNTYKPAFYFSFVEKWFCKKADFITVPTTASIQAYYPEFRSKIKVIPQGFNFDEYQFPPPVKNSKPILAYAGSFIPGLRDPSELLSFLNELEMDFEFRIYTKTPYVAPAYAKKSGGRIVICEPLARIDLLQELSTVDFVVNFENSGTTETPSKLIDYAIIKKPILPVKTGTLNNGIVLEFLKGDYSNGQLVANIDQYRIQHVCKQFLELNKK